MPTGPLGAFDLALASEPEADNEFDVRSSVHPSAVNQAMEDRTVGSSGQLDV